MQENLNEELNQTEVDTENVETEAAKNTEGCEAEASETTACEAETEEECSEEITEDEQDVSEEEKESKGFFGKKKDKKIIALEEKVAELEDRTKRQMAEFENFRKRTEKEKSMMFETGAKSVIDKILPVVDNFERGLATIPEDDENSAFANGMKMIYKQMMDELEKIGVKPIEAVGQEFDPNFHNAVMQVESEEYESGIVAQELLKGYMYHDSVVRHSMVAVVP